MTEPAAHTTTPEASLGFTGNYPLRMDSAQRVAIPAKFKEVLDRAYGGSSDQVVLLPDFEKVKVLPFPVWEKMKANLENLPALDPSSDEFRTFIYGNLSVAPLDAQNRVRLTPGLCDLASLQKEVVVVGQQDRMEIWDAAKWKEFNINTARNLKAVMAEVFRNQGGIGR